MEKPDVLYWFRQDLRLSDNPALQEAVARGRVLPIYILDDHHSKEYKMGAASRFWLHHSLIALRQQLDDKLSLFSGDPMECIARLCKRYAIKTVVWNRCYEPWRMERDTKIKASLVQQGIEVQTFNGSLLWEPWKVLKQDQSHYKVFTPFFRKGALMAAPPREPLKQPDSIALFQDQKESVSLESLDLLPKHNWDKGLQTHWNIGEKGAWQALDVFLKNGLSNYKKGRDFPAQKHFSQLSPHLHFGEISPNQVWYSTLANREDKDSDHFCSELAWREFSYSQLYFNPGLPSENLQVKFNRFPWQENQSHLRAWQKGLTGIPMVDAGMRQLWQTGFMHNRLRMIVGSFLVKNLRLHWHHGRDWFWDCLVDADLASNSASWQWIAGCGADAAPYFRVFNPVTQGQKFDPDGAFISRYIPELKNLPAHYIFSPWEAPVEVLQKAGVVLGQTYPKPVVDLKISRQQALDAFASLKANPDG